MKRLLLLTAVILGGVLSLKAHVYPWDNSRQTTAIHAANSSSNTNHHAAFQRLHLWINPANGETVFGAVSGLHGRIYMARKHDWKTPGLTKTNLVDILSGGARIVVMVLDNGPIYSSTNSGMTWTVISAPGEYEFPLTIGPKGGGMFATARIFPSPDNRTVTNPPALSWYAVGSTPNGSKLIVTGNESQPAPALTITQAGDGVVISWPAAFTGFVLQENSELASTNWADVTNSVSTVGGQNQVNISSFGGNNFYRLRPK